MVLFVWEQLFQGSATCPALHDGAAHYIGGSGILAVLCMPYALCAAARLQVAACWRNSEQTPTWWQCSWLPKATRALLWFSLLFLVTTNPPYIKGGLWSTPRQHLPPCDTMNSLTRVCIMRNDYGSCCLQAHQFIDDDAIFI